LFLLVADVAAGSLCAFSLKKTFVNLTVAFDGILSEPARLGDIPPQSILKKAAWSDWTAIAFSSHFPACMRPAITMNHYTFRVHAMQFLCTDFRFTARAFRLRTSRKRIAGTGNYCMLAVPLHFSVSLPDATGVKR
jgi:hypothetical protein